MPVNQITQMFCNQHTIFGPGCIGQLKFLLNSPPLPTLLFTHRSFLTSEGWQQLEPQIRQHLTAIVTVSGEASPQQLTAWVDEYRATTQRVLAIGGGSVLDAGKAFSTLCCHPLPVIRYMEKIGDTPLNGERLPLIAVPTTAGTGSEVTQNAVVTDQQQYQVKASLRHPGLVPDIAVLDPQLLRHCPPALLTACGIDAFTHLFESWLSNKSTLFSRQFSLQGMSLFVQAWPDLAKGDQRGDTAREKMMMASWLGGLSLSMAGLGVIHGIAGEVGACLPWHHGEVCGRLLMPFLTLCQRTDDPQQAALLNSLHRALFPEVNGCHPAAWLAEWLHSAAPADIWRQPPSMTPQHRNTILRQAGNKNSLVDYSAEQREFMLSESWPVV